MEIIIKPDSFFDKLNSIKSCIQNIKDNFKSLNEINKNYFIFPENEYQNIVKFIESINVNSSINEDLYESLRNYLKEFSKKIKESSYENNILSNIKNNNDELINLNNEIYSMKLNNIINKDSSYLKNINFYEQDKISKDYTGNFSYINNNISNNKENNYKISLVCSQCGKKPEFFCKNHCYKYFCKDCRNEFDEDYNIFNVFNSHRFESIDDEEEENKKIKFINSFLDIFKTYVEKSDNIFKDNNLINYPILTDLNEFKSQIEFLKNIYNNDINKKNNICELIKNSIVKAFKLDIPIFQIIENDFSKNDNSFVNEKMDLNNKKTPIIDYKLDKIKLIIKKNYKKIYEQNISRYDYLTDYKNIIDKLIINEMHITEDKLNSKYNFIIPKLNQIFSKDDSKYEWSGVGLNCEKIWKIEENDDNINIPKAIAFYAFYNKTSDEIKSKLYNIIMNNDLSENPNIKSKNLVLYLYHNIDIVERNTGFINFGNKKYNIALMARVLPTKKRELNKDTWILRQNEIEFISIMFKEITI